MAQITGAAFDNSKLNAFFNLTLPKIEKDVKDVIFNYHTYTKFMDKIGAIKRGQSGDGTYIQWEQARNGSVKARSFSDPIDLQDPDLNRTGFEQYGEYTGAIPLNHVIEAKNSGMEALIKYIDSRRQNLTKTMSYILNFDGMNGSGSYPAMTGIATLISTTPTAGTLHGVTRSGNTYVQNKQADSTVSTTVGFGVKVIFDVEQLLKEASKGMGGREFDLAITDKTTHSQIAYFLPDLGNSQRVIISSGKDIPGDQLKWAGENTYHLGDALVIWDKDAPSDAIRWLSKDKVHINILKDCDFVTARTHAERSFNRAILLGVACQQVNYIPPYTAVLHSFAS